jgi:hypothetical protein
MLSVAEIEAGSFKFRPRRRAAAETVFADLEHDYDAAGQGQAGRPDVQPAPKLPQVRGDGQDAASRCTTWSATR